MRPQRVSFEAAYTLNEAACALAGLWRRSATSSAAQGTTAPCCIACPSWQTSRQERWPKSRLRSRCVVSITVCRAMQHCRRWGEARVSPPSFVRYDFPRRYGSVRLPRGRHVAIEQPDVVELCAAHICCTPHVFACRRVKALGGLACRRRGHCARCTASRRWRAASRTCRRSTVTPPTRLPSSTRTAAATSRAFEVAAARSTGRVMKRCGRITGKWSRRRRSCPLACANTTLHCVCLVALHSRSIHVQ